MVAGGVAEGDSGVGAAVLAVDADGEVAQAGHGPGQVPGTALGTALADGPVSDVVQQVLDVPVVPDPGGELLTGGRTRRQAGDQADALQSFTLRALAPSRQRPPALIRSGAPPSAAHDTNFQHPSDTARQCLSPGPAGHFPTRPRKPNRRITTENHPVLINPTGPP
ncbi:hypothetical protein GCM10010405_49860 [Streptomyces macrosporus]|uniref:Uncharacterized protein n=1 Tax=Streptomyces macrosporus TaxID=44032 RepID=A0ABN3KKL6_9ACTN